MQQSNGSDLGSSRQQTPPPQPQQLPQWAPHMQQQQQQWVQYPAAAMAMQQQMMMMYPQHHLNPYMAAAYYHQQQAAAAAAYQQHPPPSPYQKQYFNNNNNHQNGGAGSAEEARTVWVGDLLHWMDETYLHTCFNQNNQVSSVKVIRNKHTGQPEGYGFVEFYSHEAAEKVLQSYNGATMPNTDQPFRINWASFAVDRRGADAGSDLSIFVGDLAADVTDTLLQETFASKYPSVRGAKVVFDANTGRAKGYGFVRFGDEGERSKAIMEMNGVYCSSRPMRLGVATPKKSSMYQQQYSSQAVVLSGHGANGAMGQGSQSDGDSNNTTIFVGGIDSDVTDEDLRQPFSQFGELVSVKIPAGKGCGFVQFANRKNAEEALESLSGTVIGKQTVRLSWGRSPANKHWRGDHNNSQWNGGYYGGQGYNGNGYAPTPAQDPNVDAAVTAASGAS